MTTLIMHAQENVPYTTHKDFNNIRKYTEFQKINVSCPEYGSEIFAGALRLESDESGLFDLSNLERMVDEISIKIVGGHHITIVGGLFERSIANAFYRINRSSKFGQIILPKDAVFSAGPTGSRNLSLHELEQKFNAFYKDVLEYVFPLPYSDKHDKIVFTKTI